MRRPILILASASPRRRELLTEAGYEFEVFVPPADVECGVCSERGPAGLVAELAERKAAAVRRALKLPPAALVKIVRHYPQCFARRTDTLVANVKQMATALGLPVPADLRREGL